MILDIKNEKDNLKRMFFECSTGSWYSISKTRLEDSKLLAIKTELPDYLYNCVVNCFLEENEVDNRINEVTSFFEESDLPWSWTVRLSKPANLYAILEERNFVKVHEFPSMYIESSNIDIDLLKKMSRVELNIVDNKEKLSTWIEIQVDKYDEKIRDELYEKYYSIYSPIVENYGKSRFIISFIEYENEPVSIGSMYISNQQCAYLSNLYTKKKFTYSGLGVYLVAAGLNYCIKTFGVKYFFLESRESAQGIYKQFGFQHLGKTYIYVKKKNT